SCRRFFSRQNGGITLQHPQCRYCGVGHRPAPFSSEPKLSLPGSSAWNHFALRNIYSSAPLCTHKASRREEHPSFMLSSNIVKILDITALLAVSPPVSPGALGQSANPAADSESRVV